MKKFTLVIGIMLASMALTHAQTQQQDWRHFSGGVYAGLVGAQIDGDSYYGYYHGGANVAATAQYPISRSFFVSLDLAYAQKGAEDKFNPNYGNLYKININYIDVPILLHWYDRKHFGFYGGFEYSRLINYKETIDNNLFPNSNYQGITEINDADYEYVAGGTYYITPQWSFDVRFCYSIIAFGDSPESFYRNGGTYNNLFEFRIGYIFGMPFDGDRKVKWLKIHTS